MPKDSFYLTNIQRIQIRLIRLGKVKINFFNREDVLSRNLKDSMVKINGCFFVVVSYFRYFKSLNLYSASWIIIFLKWLVRSHNKHLTPIKQKKIICFYPFKKSWVKLFFNTTNLSCPRLNLKNIWNDFFFNYESSLAFC